MNYIVDYKSIWAKLIPPIMRRIKQLKWGEVLMSPIQSLHDLIFLNFANGSLYNYWTDISWNVGDRCIYKNRNVYECKLAITGPTSPQITPDNTTYWKLVTDNYIGIRERIKYNSPKMLFEFALNRYFQCSGIYIVNNPINLSSFVMAESSELSSTMAKGFGQVYYMGNSYIANSTNYFTILVPLAVYNALSTDPGTRNSLVRSFADLYVLGGITYDVQTY